MKKSFRIRTTVASILTSLVVANAFALEAANPGALNGAVRRDSAIPSFVPPLTYSDPLAVSGDSPGVSITSAAGTPDEAIVTVSREPGAPEVFSKRIRIEDAQTSEVIDVDVTRDEIRAFGLAFHVARDTAGTPVALSLSANGAAINLTNDSDPDSMTPRERVALARMNKVYSATNVSARAERVRQILQRTISEARAKKGVQAQFDLSNCIWDVISLMMDWLGVVLACGTPVIVVPILCGMAIAWATYDTIMVCRAMPNDCTGGN